MAVGDDRVAVPAQRILHRRADGAGTLMKWAADVKIACPVGSMGQRVIQPIVNQQVSHVLAALEREVQNAVAG